MRMLPAGLVVLGCLAITSMQVVAQQQPRQLSAEEIKKLHTNVEKSKARNRAEVEKAAILAQQQAQLARQEDEQRRIAEENRLAEEAQAEAEWDAELAARRATAAAQKAESERALQNSIDRLNRTTDRVVREQAEARRRADEPLRPEQQRASSGNSVAEDSDSTKSGHDDANGGNASNGGSADAVRPNGLAADRSPAGGSSGGTGQRPICATQPFDSPNKAFPQGSAMKITNTCHEPLSVRICLRVEGKWDCGVNWGIPPGADWSWGSTRVYTGSFWDARLASSNQRLASPEE